MILPIFQHSLDGNTYLCRNVLKLADRKDIKSAYGPFTSLKFFAHSRVGNPPMFSHPFVFTTHKCRKSYSVPSSFNTTIQSLSYYNEKQYRSFFHCPCFFQKSTFCFSQKKEENWKILSNWFEWVAGDRSLPAIQEKHDEYKLSIECYKVTV